MASTKHKTFKLLEILYNETDINHRLKTNELIDKLSEIGISCDRRSIYDDVELFQSLGIDVKKNVGYYIDSRDLDLTEAKILSDIISSAEFLPTAYSESLVEKLHKRLSPSDRQFVAEQYFTNYMNKPKDNHIIEVVTNTINAIKNKYALEIVYQKNKYEKGTFKHTISPYSLVYNNQKYYVICSEGLSKKLYHYRIDRILSAEKSRYGYMPVSSIGDYESEIDTAEYLIHTYNMYSGELTPIVMTIHRALIEDMEKHFENPKFTNAGNDMHQCEVNANLSDGFYNFILGYGNQIKILEPEFVAEEVKKRALEIANMYE